LIVELERVVTLLVNGAMLVAVARLGAARMRPGLTTPGANLGDVVPTG
jgi:hypothetical protein